MVSKSYFLLGLMAKLLRQLLLCKACKDVRRAYTSQWVRRGENAFSQSWSRFHSLTKLTNQHWSSQDYTKLCCLPPQRIKSLQVHLGSHFINHTAAQKLHQWAPLYSLKTDSQTDSAIQTLWGFLFNPELVLMNNNSFFVNFPEKKKKI